MTLDELTRHLLDQGIYLAEWGVGEAKSIADLHHELLSGDAQLQLQPLLRLVQVVEVMIRRDDAVLVEAKQELTGGHIRRRNILPAEKIKPHESATDAAIRCLHEELGVNPQAVEIIASPLPPEVTIRTSPSYPGLSTQYTIYTVKLSVTNGLPLTNFWTDNNAPGDPVKRHHWTWDAGRGT